MTRLSNPLVYGCASCAGCFTGPDSYHSISVLWRAGPTGAWRHCGRGWRRRSSYAGGAMLSGGSTIWNGWGNSWKEARAFAPIDERGLWRALEADALDPERDLYVRCRLWWRVNDASHDGGAAGEPSPRSDEADRNRILLLRLLERGSREPLTRAELLRQLERFDETLTVLDGVDPDDPEAGLATMMRLRATQRDARLKLVNSGIPGGQSGTGGGAGRAR